MVGFLRTFCAAAAGAAAATILLAPAAPPTGSAVAASSSRWRSVRTAPGTVKAGDPVLHEPAQEVALGDIPSENVQGVINRMIEVMRKAPCLSLAAPQVGVPLRIIALEDTQEYMSYAPKKVKKDMEGQDRRPFDLLVIINPKLKNTSTRTALFFESCVSVDGCMAVVERHLDVEVSGLGRNGSPIKIQASGWQARILQHECDHLEGTLYVDKMVPRTFRIVDNWDLPLPVGCPPLGARNGDAIQFARHEAEEEAE